MRLLVSRLRAICETKKAGLPDLREARLKFNPGDVLLIFSDGITEALNPEGEEFGEERLLEILIENSNESAENQIEKIVSAVDEYSKNLAQGDDITLVVVKRIK